MGTEGPTNTVTASLESSKRRGMVLLAEELRRFCGIVTPLRLHLENREFTDGFPFLLEIWEMPDDGNLLPANALRIHGECLEFFSLLERLSRGITSVKSLHFLYLARLIVIYIDRCGGDGRLLSLPGPHILPLFAQGAAEKALLAQTRARVRRNRHANTH